MVALKIRELVETLSTILKIASVNSGIVSTRLMVLDRRPKLGNLFEFAAIMATLEFAFPVVEVRVIGQRLVA